MKKVIQMAYLIGIDIGTSGTKTILFDEKGTCIASKTVEYPLYQPHNGWAEQDPEDWWRATVEGLRAITAGIDTHEVRGIGLSGQMHGLVMLDADGKVLRRSIIWCDQRTGEECRELTQRVGAERLMEITKSPAVTGFTASKILWVRNHEPDLFEKCKTILLPKDYIRFRLTGERATEVSDASGMQLMNIEKRCWSDEVLEKIGLDKSVLGHMYESVEVTGQVTESVANLTGLSSGTPVVGGAGDNAASAIGCGVVHDGDAFTTIGTSGVVFAHTRQLTVDPSGRIHSFCAAVPGEYHVMGVTQAAGLSLKWFRDQFCAPEKDLAGKMKLDPYQIMDDEAAKVSIGAGGLLYLPYLNGERTPYLDPDVRGAFLGLTPGHERAALIRAVMEGVAYSLRDCLSIFSGAGATVRTMRVCGGGSVSALWRQMLADNMNLTVSTLTSNEGGALGAAILASVGSGIYSTLQQACDAIIRTKTTQDPIPEHVTQYKPYYDIYTRAYSAVRDISHALVGQLH